MKQFLLSLFCIGILSIIMGIPAHAQEVTLSVTPSTQEIVSRPGQSFTVQYVVSNLGDPQQVSIKVISLVPQADGTMQVTSKFSGPLQLSLLNEDVHLSEPFFLRGNEKKVLSLSIQVPQVIQEKDYYIGLVAQSQAPPTNEGTITTRAQLGVVSNLAISVTSDGSLETKPKLVAFQLDTNKSLNLFGKKYSLVLTGDTVPLIFEVANQGRHLIKAQGNVSVRGFGPKKNFVITPQSILASSQSSLSLESNTLSGFFFGPYSVTATINFGPSSPIIYATTNVFALPSLPLLATVILLVIFLGFRFYTRRNH